MLRAGPTKLPTRPIVVPRDNTRAGGARVIAAVRRYLPRRRRAAGVVPAVKAGAAARHGGHIRHRRGGSRRLVDASEDAGRSAPDQIYADGVAGAVRADGGPRLSLAAAGLAVGRHAVPRNRGLECRGAIRERSMGQPW